MVPGQETKISLVTYNIEGFERLINDEDLRVLIGTADIVSRVETWHTTQNFDLSCLYSDYFVFSQPAHRKAARGRASGGIILLCKKSCVENVVILLQNRYCLVMQGKFHGLTVNVATAYVPPDARGHSYTEDFSRLMNDIQSICEDNATIFCGDINARVGAVQYNFAPEEVTPHWLLSRNS